MTKRQIEKRIAELKQLIAEENEKDKQRYLFLFMLYGELEQLENELKDLATAENKIKKSAKK